MKSFYLICLLCIVTLCLTACAGAIVGGAVVGTSVAIDNRTTGDLVEDQNIKAKYLHLYHQDKTLSKQTHINVTSYNRQLLITGEAPSQLLKQRLNQIAQRIKNVRRYYNEVSIGPESTVKSRSNDTWITSKIKSSVLANIKRLDGAQVKVVTEQGHVFLMGIVSPKQAEQITDITRRTRGVKRVIKLFEYPNPNDIRI